MVLDLLQKFWLVLAGGALGILAWVFRRDVRARLQGLKRGAEQGRLLERLRQPCG